MKFTNFFRPTIPKVIVLIILAVAFVPFINYDTGIRCITTPCPSSASGSILMYLLFSYNFNIYTGGINYIILVIGLIISYLASCIIIFLFKKKR